MHTDAHGRVDACFVLEVTCTHPGIFNGRFTKQKIPLKSSSSLEKEGKWMD
jgi:hypothetical protein